VVAEFPKASPESRVNTVHTKGAECSPPCCTVEPHCHNSTQHVVKVARIMITPHNCNSVSGFWKVLQENSKTEHAVINRAGKNGIWIIIRSTVYGIYPQDNGMCSRQCIQWHGIPGQFDSTSRYLVHPQLRLFSSHRITLHCFLVPGQREHFLLRHCLHSGPCQTPATIPRPLIER
jgi:hypothetical protein